MFTKIDTFSLTFSNIPPVSPLRKLPGESLAFFSNLYHWVAKHAFFSLLLLYFPFGTPFPLLQDFRFYSDIFVGSLSIFYPFLAPDSHHDLPSSSYICLPERWVAWLVSRTALWVRIQTSPNNAKCAT